MQCFLPSFDIFLPFGHECLVFEGVNYGQVTVDRDGRDVQYRTAASQQNEHEPWGMEQLIS